jgi:hypothetical protein
MLDSPTPVASCVYVTRTCERSSLVPVYSETSLEHLNTTQVLLPDWRVIWLICRLLAMVEMQMDVRARGCYRYG